MDDQRNDKQNLNRWKLLQKAHYKGATLDFLQLIFNVKKKYERVYTSLEWLSAQTEMQGVTERRVQQIIHQLREDGVLKVNPSPRDRRRNSYDLDYDKLADRAARPKPSRK